MIFEDEGKDKKPTETVDSSLPPVSPGSVPAPFSPIGTSTPTAPMPVALDPAIKAKFEEVIGQANQKSYTHFRQMYDSMSVIADPRARMQAALAACKVGGFPAEEVIRGINVILSAVDQFEREAEIAVPAQIEERVGVREREVEQVQEVIRQREQSISDMQAEISRLKDRRQTVVSELEAEKVKITARLQGIRDVARVMKDHYAQERAQVEQFKGGA